MPGMYESTEGFGTKQQSAEAKLSRVESDATPFVSTLRDAGKAAQLLHTFEMQTISSGGFGGTLDGADVDEFDKVTVAEAQTRCMQIRKSWHVTQFADATDLVTNEKQKARQRAAAMIKLKYANEQAFLSKMDLQADDGTLANQTRGAFQWLDPTQGTLHPVPSDFRITSDQWITDAIADITETTIETALTAAASQTLGERALFMPCGADLKNRFDSFTKFRDGNATTQIPVQSYNANIADKKYVQCVDFLQFSSGTVALKQHYHLLHDQETGLATAYSPKSGIAIDLTQWASMYMRKLNEKELEDKGGGARGYVDIMKSLMCLNPRGQFAVYTNAAS